MCFSFLKEVVVAMGFSLDFFLLRIGLKRKKNDPKRKNSGPEPIRI